MMNMGEAIKAAMTTLGSSGDSLSEHVCQYCQQVVPKKHLTICGVPKVVQPVCKCEAQAYDQGVFVAAQKSIDNEIERKFSISVLGDRFQECRFATFITRPGAEKAATMAKEYPDMFEEMGGDSLFIWGEPGNGKSHLAAAICHEMKDRGKTPVFQSTPELLGRIRSTFNKSNKESEKEIMTALLECQLLVLDDIGAEKVTDWVLEILFRIIDGRYRQKRPTLFTTNYSPDELATRFLPDRRQHEITKEDQIKAKRLIDRIIEVSLVVENKARSYRMEVAARRKQYNRGEPA